MRYIQSRKGLYIHTNGVAWPGSGLEIKERVKGEDDKPKLKGYYVSDAGFFHNKEEAVGKAITLISLKRYQQRVLRRGLIV